MPCLPRSTPAAPGHLTAARRRGDRPSTARSSRFTPDHSVVGGEPEAQQLGAQAGLGPTAAAVDGWCGPSRPGVRSPVVHQCGEHVFEHHSVWDAAAVTAPRVGWGELRAIIDPDQAANSAQAGLISDVGNRGTCPPEDHRVSATSMITWGPYLCLQRHASNINCGRS